MQLHAETTTPATEINALIARHGYRRIILALAAALFHAPARPQVLHEAELSDHLRRDVGLTPLHIPAHFRLPR